MKDPYCFPQWLYQFTIPPKVYKGFFPPHLPQHLSLVYLMITILIGVRCFLILILICIFPIVSGVEQVARAKANFGFLGSYRGPGFQQSLLKLISLPLGPLSAVETSFRGLG